MWQWKDHALKQEGSLCLSNQDKLCGDKHSSARGKSVEGWAGTRLGPVVEDTGRRSDFIVSAMGSHERVRNNFIIF